MQTASSEIPKSLFLLAWSLLWALSSASAPAATPQEQEYFETRIRPVLVERCYECHNSTGRAEGGLVLDYREGLLTGGDSGAAVDLEHPAASLLLRAMRHERELRMPQDGPKLSEQVIADFERWVTNGAFDPRVTPPSPAEIKEATSWEAVRERRSQWWSFQPIANPLPPLVQDFAPSGSDHTIDRFLLARLEAAGIAPSSPADRSTLLRRLHFALVGLPPTPAELSEFAEDDSPDAYTKVVERLLASPQFGERWARHWMDWFRYADSHGSEGDPAIPNAWRYRDYLIRAFNADVPYDQLVREHVAGDLLAEPRVDEVLKLNESAIGTSHFRFVEHGYAPTDPQEELVRTTDNQIDVLTKAFLGLTVSCARCHDHKFDPISQKDFYALYGILTSCRPAQITVDSAERQALHIETLLSLKAEIKQRLSVSWLRSLDEVAEWLEAAPVPSVKQQRADSEAATKWSLAQRRVNVAIDQGLRNPLYPWLRIRAADESSVSSLWSTLTQDWRASQARLDERRSANLAFRWSAGSDKGKPWFSHGSGMESGPAASGDFHLAVEGDQIVTNIYPAGVYSHLISSKHSGQFTSPSFPVSTNAIWIRALGNHARARYVMHNYPRAAGPIYAHHGLNSAEPQWQRWDMRYWEGDQTHLEFATSGDVPVEVGEQARSWFGVCEVLAIDEGQAQPQDEPAEFVSPLFRAASAPPKSLQELRGYYTQALSRCIAAWQRGDMTDEQAHFLGYFVRQGALPNSPMANADVLPFVKKYRELEAEITVPTRVPGITEAEPKDQPLFVRGNHKQPSDPVRRSFLEALDPAPFQTSKSGRLELAESILAADNPLMSRVIVNRVWHHLFGRGIVATPDNFGHLGELPTHPELLDHLAKKFEADGYSMKKLIRYMVTARVYRSASSPQSEAKNKDPGNQWLSHMRVRRLEAEVIRDTLLQLSGELDSQMFGPGVDGKSLRRSVYVESKRNSLDSFLSVFDAPAPFSTKGRRDATNVPAQALAMMNNPFVRSCTDKWGDRIVAESSMRDDQSRIQRCFLEAFSRQCTSEELATSVTYLQQLRESAAFSNLDKNEREVSAWRAFTHSIVGLKEFLYLR